MPRSSWVETLMVSEGDGPALTTNGVSTSILAAQAKFRLDPNFFNRIGKSIRIRAYGRETQLAVSTNSHAISVLFGGTVVFTSVFLNSATAKTDQTWMLDLTLTARAIGPTANLMGAGMIQGINAGAVTMMIVGTLPPTAPAVGNNFDATASQVVDLNATITTTAISSFQLNQYILESLN
jgi:hypothetical protein